MLKETLPWTAANSDARIPSRHNDNDNDKDNNNDNT